MGLIRISEVIVISSHRMILCEGPSDQCLQCLNTVCIIYVYWKHYCMVEPVCHWLIVSNYSKV